MGVLKRLFLLIDARRDELTEMDRTVMTWLEDAEIPYSVVLTKTDRISKPIVIKLVNELCMRYASLTALEGDDGYACQSPVIHTTSSKRNWGIHELMLSVETEFAGDDDDDDYEEEDL
jgi:GTP-binding protein